MKRFWILAGALAVTLGALALAMLLGSASFDFRRYTEHQQPPREGAARAADGRPPDAGPRGRGHAAPRRGRGRARSWSARPPRRGGQKAAEIREKARAPRRRLRVYQAGDMLYFVYFDAGGVMRDFTCVSR